jgi:hypothetical protein
MVVEGNVRLTRPQVYELISRADAITRGFIPISPVRGGAVRRRSLLRLGLMHCGFELSPAGWALVRQLLMARGITPTPRGLDAHPLPVREFYAVKWIDLKGDGKL